jgi:thiamine-monophosphate kinase
LKPALPVSRAAKLRARGHVHEDLAESGTPPAHGHVPKPAALAALTDGEDFELLFTIASRDAVKLLDAWKKKFPRLKLSCIGKIVAGEGILLRDKTGAHKFNAPGYEHFQKP